MLFSHLYTLAALKLIMPTKETDLGFTEWTQLSTHFSQKIKSLAVKKKLEGPTVCSNLLLVSLLLSVKLKVILWWLYHLLEE